MRPISYEIRRTLSSKFVIILMVMIILATTGLAYLLAVTSTNTTSFVPTHPNLSVGYYRTGENVTFVGYAYTSDGALYTGHDFSVTVRGASGAGYTGTPNNAGFVNITLPYNSSQAYESYTYNYSYKLFGSTQSSSPSTLIVVNTSLYSGYTFTPNLINSSNNSKRGFQLMYVGANGTLAPKTSIYVSVYNASQTTDILKSMSNSIYNVTASGFNVVTVFPAIPPNDLNKSFTVIYNQSGLGHTPSAKFVPYLSVYTPVTQKSLQTSVLSSIGGLLSEILIPVLGIFTAYFIYGKDKTSGVLESVLKRPVTRHGLLSSRFSANAISILIAVLSSMVIADLFINHYFGMYLDLSFSAFFVWTYVIEGLSYLAIIYMFSHLLKSSGALLGVSVAVFVVLALFWNVIVEIVFAVLHIASGTSSYVLYTVISYFLTPVGYHSLVQFHYTNQVGSAGITANPATYGVTIPSIIITGILWVAVPFIIALVLSGRRD